MSFIGTLIINFCTNFNLIFMKKTSFLFLFMLFVTSVVGQGSITSKPSPLVSSKSGKIIINANGTSVSGDAYLYSWIVIGGKTIVPVSWTGCIVDKYKLTNEGSGIYSYQIADFQQFFGLTNDQLTALTSANFIARTNTAQTGNLSLDVVQVAKIYYSGGEGTLSSPYLVSKSQDLTDLTVNTSDFQSYFKLVNDVNLVDVFVGIGTNDNPFKGFFDGNGFAIKNLRMNNKSFMSTGFFNFIDGATISKLSIIGANIAGTTFTGTLIGTASTGTVEQCYTSGTVNGNGICVGGMVGVNEKAQFRNCYSTCNVNNTSDNVTGGFVGKNSGTITNAYATGSINGLEFIGGFVGVNYGSINNSVAINNPINSTKSFVARFGGNNNELNKSLNNFSWISIRLNTDNNWTQMGDHATVEVGDNFKEKPFFESTLGWDFSSVWEWDILNFPKLIGVKTQVMTFPEDFTEITGIEDLKYGVDVSIYPNPTFDKISVTSTENISKLNLFDITGKRMISVNNTTIKMASMSKGIYILKIYNDNNQFVAIKKIIKL